MVFELTILFTHPSVTWLIYLVHGENKANISISKNCGGIAPAIFMSSSVPTLNSNFFAHSLNALFLTGLRIHWRLLTILKTTNKSVWCNPFSYIKVCIFWNCIQYTIHWDKTQMLKTISLGQNKWYKYCYFYFWKLQLITVLLLICDSYKTVCGIFHFQFRSIFIKVYIFV